MDWDGIGTFALFLSSGAVGIGIVLLRAYKAKLASKLEWARLEQGGSDPDYADERIRELEEHVKRLSERVDFSEKLLEKGQAASGEADSVEGA
ncbi:MAG: hypothetical protein HKN72_06275 [Gemmatimonadetes bacterium]|nr:hypothetical protein [Gemmatimonadota bacterium]